jgi:hypothetical protein
MTIGTPRLPSAVFLNDSNADAFFARYASNAAWRRGPWTTHGNDAEEAWDVDPGSSVGAALHAAANVAAPPNATIHIVAERILMGRTSAGAAPIATDVPEGGCTTPECANGMTMLGKDALLRRVDHLVGIVKRVV